MPRQLRTALHRLKRDESGSITIEFVLWIPLLAFWLAFSVAVFNAHMVRNQTAKAANTLADIVSRHEVMNQALFDRLHDLEGKLLTLAREGAELRISSVKFVRIDPDSEEREFEVQWSLASDGVEPLTTADFPFDRLPVMAETDSILYTEVTVPWTPFSLLAGIASYDMSFGIASRPRGPALQIAQEN